MGQRSQRSADWTSKLSPAFLSTNKTHVSVALNRVALLWIPKYFYAFLKSWEQFLGSERVPFWQICLKLILMHMVCVHAHMKTHLETLKAADEVCGYSSVKNSCLLHNLKTGKYQTSLRPCLRKITCIWGDFLAWFIHPEADKYVCLSDEPVFMS